MRNRSFNFVVTRKSGATVARGAAFAGDAGQVPARRDSPTDFPAEFVDSFPEKTKTSFGFPMTKNLLNKPIITITAMASKIPNSI